MKNKMYDAKFFDIEFDKAVEYVISQAEKVLARDLLEENVVFIRTYASSMRSNHRIISCITNRLTSCFIRPNTDVCHVVRWENENRKRRLICYYLVTRTLLRMLKKDLKVPYLLRLTMALVLDKMPKNSAWTRKKNRDVISGRPRGYMRKFGLSGHNVKQKFSDGEVPGLRVSTW